MNNKIHKLVEKYHVNLVIWMILPISALIGILWQVTILSKYNAVVFFSWSQVFVDTALMFLPIISFISGLLSYIIYCNVLKPKWKEKWIAFIFIIFSIILFALILWLIWYINLYLFNLCFFFLFGYITNFAFITSGIWEKMDPEKYSFLFPSAILGLVLAAGIVITSFFNIWYNHLYSNIQIQIESKKYKVQYMNDKYIIYSDGKVIPNNDSVKFVISKTIIK